MALVGVRVADRRHDAHLLLAVELSDPACGRVPEEAAVLRERGAAREPELRAELAVERIALRREHRQRIRAALEEDADEYGLRRPRSSGGDALLERREAEP